MDDYSNIFIIDELSKNTLINIVSSFFNEGIHTTIDLLNNKLTKYNNALKEIANELSSNLDSDNAVKVEKTEKEGHYLITTKKRYEILKKKCDMKKYNSNTFLSYT